MNRLLLALLLGCGAVGQVSAQSSLFVADPGSANAPRPIPRPTALGAVIEYPVTPNVLAIASHPGQMRIAIPGKSAFNIDSRRFDPIAGFILQNDEVVVDPAATAADISFNWYGVSNNGVEISIAVHRGTMSGRITMKGGLYSVALSRDAQNGHVLRKLDPSKFPAALEDTPVAGTAKAPELPDLPIRRPEASDPVSVLVVYTANALTAAGGQAGIDAMIQQSISDLTQSFINSDVVSINPVLVTPGGSPGVQVVYDESPTISDIATRWYAHRTFARTDATIQGLRNAYQADLVVMLVGDTGTCGVAYTQRPACGDPVGEYGCSVGAGYAAFAASVVSTQCSTQTLTFPHEVGHQFGMEHDIAYGVAAGSASYLWSYGYPVSTPSVQARTIMSYPYTCVYGCPVYMNYSNPSVSFAAYPGTATGTTVVDANGRWTFNARTASLLAPAMSNFRGVAITDRLFRNDFESLPDIPPP